MGDPKLLPKIPVSCLLAFIHRKAALSIFLPSSPGCPNHLEEVLEPESITKNTSFGPKASIFRIFFSPCILFPLRFLLWSWRGLMVNPKLGDDGGIFHHILQEWGSLAQGSKVPVVF